MGGFDVTVVGFAIFVAPVLEFVPGRGRPARPIHQVERREIGDPGIDEQKTALYNR